MAKVFPRLRGGRRKEEEEEGEEEQERIKHCQNVEIEPADRPPV